MNSALRWGRVLVVFLCVTNAAPTNAEGFRLGASAGVTNTNNQTYFSLGGRLGYDVAFGVTPEVGLTFWLGGTPSIVELSPGITWYMPLPLIRPYVGAFYSYQFMGSGYPNQDAIGGRAGIQLLGGGPVSVAIGAAYKKLLSCPANLTCETWWPEAFAGVAF